MKIGTILRIAKHPGSAFRAARELLRGRTTVWNCRLRGLDLRAGTGLRIAGRLVVRGPGRVIIGDNVRIGDTVTPWTYSPGAMIEIGSDCFLNGASFGCYERISIGPRCIVGRSAIMDSDFHSTRADRHDPKAPVRVAPVRLEENVWVAAQAGILPGTRIGRNSVVGFGSVCVGEYPADTIIAGNPARAIKGIPALPAGTPADPDGPDRRGSGRGLPGSLLA